YLETAPWNWSIPELSQTGEYRGLGTLLFREAVKLSLEEEFQGRVGLHALPQAESFYREVCGMRDLGLDKSKEGLRYFELSPADARRFLESGGE
ncbi:MAG: hypothetical protein KF708_24205, partial [Pirellulales bacterium]|nr:hypothetical protein [Pirellulales bacterium]